MSGADSTLNVKRRRKRCIAIGCPNADGENGKSYVYVTEDKTRRTKWFRAVGYKWAHNKRAFLCEDHFDAEKDLYFFNGRVKARKEVVPKSWKPILTYNSTNLKFPRTKNTQTESAWTIKLEKELRIQIPRLTQEEIDEATNSSSDSVKSIEIDVNPDSTLGKPDELAVPQPQLEASKSPTEPVVSQIENMKAASATSKHFIQQPTVKLSVKKASKKKAKISQYNTDEICEEMTISIDPELATLFDRSSKSHSQEHTEATEENTKHLNSNVTDESVNKLNEVADDVEVNSLGVYKGVLSDNTPVKVNIVDVEEIAARYSNYEPMSPPLKTTSGDDEVNDSGQLPINIVEVDLNHVNMKPKCKQAQRDMGNETSTLSPKNGVDFERSMTSLQYPEQALEEVQDSAKNSNSPSRKIDSNSPKSQTTAKSICSKKPSPTHLEVGVQKGNINPMSATRRAAIIKGSKTHATAQILRINSDLGSEASQTAKTPTEKIDVADPLGQMAVHVTKTNTSPTKASKTVGTNGTTGEASMSKRGRDSKSQAEDAKNMVEGHVTKTNTSPTKASKTVGTNGTTGRASMSKRGRVSKEKRKSQAEDAKNMVEYQNSELLGQRPAQVLAAKMKTSDLNAFKIKNEQSIAITTGKQDVKSGTTRKKVVNKITETGLCQTGLPLNRREVQTSTLKPIQLIASQREAPENSAKQKRERKANLKDQNPEFGLCSAVTTDEAPGSALVPIDINSSMVSTKLLQPARKGKIADRANKTDGVVTNNNVQQGWSQVPLQAKPTKKGKDSAPPAGDFVAPLGKKRSNLLIPDKVRKKRKVYAGAVKIDDVATNNVDDQNVRQNDNLSRPEKLVQKRNIAAGANVVCSLMSNVDGNNPRKLWPQMPLESNQVATQDQNSEPESLDTASQVIKLEESPIIVGSRCSERTPLRTLTRRRISTSNSCACCDKSTRLSAGVTKESRVRLDNNVNPGKLPQNNLTPAEHSNQPYWTEEHPDKYRCHHCGDPFPSKTRLEIHLALHAPNFTCGQGIAVSGEDGVDGYRKFAEFITILDEREKKIKRPPCNDPFADPLTVGTTDESWHLRNWTSKLKFPPVFPSPPPPYVNCPEARHPLDYFFHFFTPDLLKLTLRATNTNISSLRREFNLTIDEITLDELLKFVSLLFLHDIFLGGISDWLGAYNLPVDKILRQERFEMILRVLSFSLEPSNDVVELSAPLVDYFNERMSKISSPAKNLIIDASARVGDNLYFWNSSIDVKYHSALYSLSEKDGLVQRLCLYRGEADIGNPVLNKLMVGLYDKGYSLYAKELLCSVQMLEELAGRQTYCTGALTDERRVFPTDAILNNDNLTRYSKLGICFCRFSSNRKYICASSEFDGNDVRSKDLKTGRYIRRPHILEQFLHVTKRPLSNREPPSTKMTLPKGHCGFKLTCHVFALMMRNAFVLFSRQNRSNLNLKDFQWEVVRYLISFSVPVQLSDELTCHLPRPVRVNISNSGQQPRLACSSCRNLCSNVYCSACPSQPKLCSTCYKNKHSNVNVKLNLPKK